jgi:hypothetical protein
MLENLFETLNVLLLQHPDLLGVMRFLFWFKSWLIVGVFSIFVYLVYTDGHPLGKKKLSKCQKQGVFIA